MNKKGILKDRKSFLWLKTINVQIVIHEESANDIIYPYCETKV